YAVGRGRRATLSRTARTMPWRRRSLAWYRFGWFRLREQVEKPLYPDIDHRDFRRHGIEPEAGQGQRGVEADNLETAGVHRNEPPWQGGDQVGLGDDGEREHEVRHGQRDPSGQPALGEELVDEALRIAGMRNHDVPHRAELLQGGVGGERVPLAPGLRRGFRGRRAQ